MSQALHQNKTFMAKPSNVQQEWLHIDADGLILGRLASAIAMVLMGKHKPQYTPHIDVGDFVVVTNAAKLRYTGLSKGEKRLYDRFSGYPSGLKRETLGELIERKPDMVLELAVRRMLPKNKLGRKMLKKLKIFRGPEHPHAAQQPKPWPYEPIKKLDS